MSHRARRTLLLAFTYFFLIVAVVLTLWPVAWTLSTSFKATGDLFATPPQWIPLRPTLQPYLQLFAAGNPFATWYRNSAIVAVATVLLGLLLAVFAGYALSRYSFRGSTAIMLFILSSQMFPVVLLLIAIYVIFRDLGQLNTLTGLVLAYMAFALPFSVWMMKSYIDTIPMEIEESALIDGCTRLGVLFKITLPLLAPAVVSVGVFNFLVAWSELMFALTLNTTDLTRTFPPGLIIRYAGQYQSLYNEMMAGSMLVTLPVILIFVFLQRYVVEGMTLGAVKG
jgi:multiple sugar transport system permease protein